ncbi:FAD-binding oxidoreductase [Candidatus Albibeggiatoa sp. nov. NOAA]|uniref:FAD-binding oxidoreductase n=1 Tax=Candidatus Albibeggiatoa sp. nov. NOAA TaxID=3162724 RepID=UPI0032F68638|nr:FAD-binding oxidoreductase [Thiotrichaceae bacterium]
MTQQFESWGRFPRVSQTVKTIRWRHEILPLDNKSNILPYGLGRSYGDVCLNDNGLLLHTRQLNRFISFDEDTGLLRCEAGVSFAEILQHFVPRGWFLPTTPGTKYVTVGGAIANDVHGKNHHRAGTFGQHITQFELVTSDGQRHICSPQNKTEYYNATIGGLGLTGLITWAEFHLRPIHHRAIHQQMVKFANLEDFFQLSAESDEKYEYTMAWVDCLAQGDNVGRGIFFRGNHVAKDQVKELIPNWQPPLVQKLPEVLRTMPINLPSFALNSLTVKAFNFLLYHKQRIPIIEEFVDYEPFFYPLDSILEWKRLYGTNGFLQYQFVVPYEDHQVIRKILQTIAKSGLSSFLAVLKTFGELESPGLLSFPRKGVTLALDFPIKGEKTFLLLEQLDDMVQEAGGAVYPCKDARLSPRHFKAYYPQWEEFAQYTDSRFSSSFWRRVTRNVT